MVWGLTWRITLSIDDYYSQFKKQKKHISQIETLLASNDYLLRVPGLSPLLASILMVISVNNCAYPTLNPSFHLNDVLSS